jgi:hypothetical protein
MKHRGIIVATLTIGVVGFLGGREAHGWLGARGDTGSVGQRVTPGRGHSGEPVPERRAPEGGGAVRQANAPLRAAPLPASATDLALLANVTEPPEVTEGRRKGVLKEIAEKTSNLAPEKRELILRESDRLALNKRKLRDAFLHGQISEVEYVAALKDGIRTAMAAYEGGLTDSEYAALTDRVRGSGIDPFSMESLTRTASPNKDTERPVEPPPSSPLAGHDLSRGT